MMRCDSCISVRIYSKILNQKGGVGGGRGGDIGCKMGLGYFEKLKPMQYTFCIRNMIYALSYAFHARARLGERLKYQVT